MTPQEAAAKLQGTFSWIDPTKIQATFDVVVTPYGPLAYLGSKIPPPMSLGVMDPDAKIGAPRYRDVGVTAVLPAGASLERIAEWKQFVLAVAKILGADADEGIVIKDTFFTRYKDVPAVELASGFRSKEPLTYAIAWMPPANLVAADQSGS